MKKLMYALIICGIVLFVACGSGDDYDAYEDTYSLPEDILHAVDIPRQEISEFGLQVATEFLSDFWTIFDTYAGWRNDATGSLYVLDRNLSPWGWVEEAATIPRAFLGTHPWEVFDPEEDYRWSFSFNGGVYDAQGNSLLSMSFVRVSDNPYRHPAVASDFMLFDLTGNGIPEIIVNYIYWGSSGFGFSGQPTLFKFIDGAYRDMGQLLNQAAWFFTDADGRLIVFFENHLENFFGYYYLSFTDNAMNFELASPIEDDWQLHHSWDLHHHEFFLLTPFADMFITNEPMARFTHLDDIHRQITEALTE